MTSVVTNESLRWQLRLAKDVLDAQEAEIERLRDALEFYAKESNYHSISLMLRKLPEHEHPPVVWDYGRRAREALTLARTVRDEIERLRGEGKE